MQDKKPNTPNKKRISGAAIFFSVILALIVGFFLIRYFTSTPVEYITVDEILEKKEEVKSYSSIPVGGENGEMILLTFEMKSGKTLYKVYVDDYTSLEKIKDEMSEVADVTYTTTPKASNNIWEILLYLVPIVLVVVFMIIFMKASSGSNNKAFDFAKSRAQLNRSKTTTFKDVAGCDEEKEELEEIIDFLKTPKKYSRMGVKIPKGVLLVGPPGTGKTLLARAVAGEANVPFFTISGADFVEMFVGVGASRVRDLFKVARENAPCIIFIDEIDAVGRQRGAGLGGGNDEREQTLNQLLVEMDGFSNHTGIIVMAATNRADILDPALLRPGRFDRQIIVNIPDLKGREEILAVHARNKRFASDVNLKDIAPRIPGFSGADIENLLNEAGLLAARANKDAIDSKDIDEAIDRVLMGPAKKSRKYDDKEKAMVAYHEAGHAVVGIKFENANTVQKVTIIPRGHAGGYNLMMPEKEKFLATKNELLESITGFLAGRAAEELIFDEITTGASNDFSQATKIARSMVTEYGMSSMGPVTYESQNQDVFLGRDYLKEKNFSDQVANEIDSVVRSIITDCYIKAKQCLIDNKDLLDNIANYLIRVETLTKRDIDEIVATGHLKAVDEVNKPSTPEEAPEASKEEASTTEETSL